MLEKKDDLKLKGIKNAQDRKDLAIAYFNATNNAIELVKSMPALEMSSGQQIKEGIVAWRDWFLSEHLEYRARVTEKVGASYNPTSILESLKTTKNIDEVKALFLGLTQDERSDPEVKLAFSKARQSYETIQRD